MATLDEAELRRDALKYFAKTNYINKQITHQENLFIKYLGSRWNDTPFPQRDALLDLLFVDDEVRENYYGSSGETVKTNRTSDDLGENVESFPRLYLNSGQKINVDFESDLWTWRDEHSGPFSWLSRSQQDLTLADLGPDNISKPQAKSLRLDADETVFTTKAEPQLNRPSSSWCHDIIDDFRKHEQDIVLTPSPSVIQINSQTETGLEEVNAGFQDSCDNLPQNSTPNQESNSAINGIQEQDIPSPEKKGKGKDKSRRSPSPKKILRSGSFKKSPCKTSDQGEEKLIPGNDTEVEDGAHVFSNPVMESEWSAFVGEDNSKTSSFVQAPSGIHAPESMSIDRGAEVGSNSPYRGDQVCLLDRHSVHTESSSSPALHTSHITSDWSAESTPDHTTHLLKGMQSPVHRKHIVNTESVKIQPTVHTPSDLAADSPDQDIPPMVQMAETDEVLRVEVEGEKIVVTTEPEQQPQGNSDIPTTGFDFLDNW